MDSMHSAYQTIADVAGLSELQSNSEGFIELIIADALPIFIQEAGESEIELSCRLPEFDGLLSPAVLVEMLIENAGASAGRLAIEPDAASVVFCRRLDIALLSPDQLIERVNLFIRDAARWASRDGAALRERAATRGASRNERVESLIRI